MLIDFNEDYITVFVRKFAFRRCGLKLHIFVLNCITKNDENYASFCLVNMMTVPNFLEFTTNAVLHPTFIQKLCYKLSSFVTFTFIQIFFIKIVPSLLNGIRVAAFA